MSNEKQYQVKWGDKDLIIKTGKLALQADVAILAQYGETVVLATVVQGEERSGIDFLPLMVDFEEKLYAAGIIKGSRWIKREGRPTDDSILTARMIDRTIRPLFNQSLRRDIQVLLTVLSVDKKNDHDIVAFAAASIALMISGIDWAGPVGAVRVGRINGKFVMNPGYEERIKSDFDLIVAGTNEKVVMIEAEAKEVVENDFFEAIQFGQKALLPLINFSKEIKKDFQGKEKKDIVNINTEDASLDVVKKWLDENVEKFLFNQEYYKKNERKAAVKKIKEQLKAFL